MIVTISLLFWLDIPSPLSFHSPSSPLQAGKQLEYLTGGHVQAGFHEVVVTEQTQAVVTRKKVRESQGQRQRKQHI